MLFSHHLPKRVSACSGVSCFNSRREFGLFCFKTMVLLDVVVSVNPTTHPPSLIIGVLIYHGPQIPSELREGCSCPLCPCRGAQGGTGCLQSPDGQSYLKKSNFARLRCMHTHLHYPNKNTNTKSSYFAPKN